MPILQTSRLRDYLKEQEARETSLSAALTVAEALAASYIGADTLLRQTRSENPEVRLETRLVPLTYGPITGLTKVVVDGDDVTSTTGYTYWAIRLQQAAPAGADISVEYTTGWNPEDLPEPIEAAILMTAASVYARPDAGLARVVRPDVVEVYQSNFLSGSARTLLDPYRRVVL